MMGEPRREAMQGEVMRISLWSALILFVIASPAAALLGDQEPSNDHWSTAAIQIIPSTVSSIAPRPSCANKA